MMKYLSALIVVFWGQLSIAQFGVIPTPTETIERTGQILFESGEITVKKGMLGESELAFFESEFSIVGLELKESFDAPHIEFQLLDSISTEGYVLDIQDQIVISYSDVKGRFYAFMSLLQLIHHRKHTHYVKNLRISDAPAFQWRGLHLDVSRHFFTVDEVKRFIDLMALYKFNTFHWHLTDDQGWRIQIDQYPKLTEIGAYRDSTVNGHYTDSPRTYTKEMYGGFYTKDDIREVVNYASERQINIVPEIEMPGHSRAALAAYPELSCTGEQQGVPGLWGIFDDIYCTKESSIDFMQNVLDEVLELFPSEYIHIGGDEAPKTRWNECSECKKVMYENGVHDAHELQSYFIGRMDKYLTKKGRKLIGWDEILEGGLSPNATVMSWRGEKGGIEAAKQGHYVVMSPTTYCYFDYYQSSHEIEPLAIGGFLPLEKVYEYSPVPKGLTQGEAKYVLGGQANVWTEYIPTFDQVEYMTYPRALALMQGLWCENKPSYEEFLKEYLEHQEEYLEKHGVNVAKSIHLPELKLRRGENGLELTWESNDSNEEFDYQWEEKCVSNGPGSGALVVNTIIPGVKLKSGDSLVLSLKGNHCQKTYSIQLDNLENDLEYTFHGSDCLGAEIEMLTSPHPKYNHNGSLNLVDGILGDEDRWKGDQWLGFREEKIEFIVDLGEEKEIEKIAIGFLNQNGSWIYLPMNYEVYVSNDKEDWRVQPQAGNIPLLDMKVTRVTSKHDCTARYVKFVVTPLAEIPVGNGGAGSTPWTFIDEIQINTK